MADGRIAGMGPGAAWTGEYGPRKILENMARKSPKIDYLFVDRSAVMNWARQKLGPGAVRTYSKSGKWIGWRNSTGNEIYWGHGDWGKGLGSSKYPHINYEIDGIGGHLFLEDKIINRSMWSDFVNYFKLE